MTDTVAGTERWNLQLNCRCRNVDTTEDDGAVKQIFCARSG
jgi:hypothetical protein